MAKKDKFQKMRQDTGALSSFQDMVTQATTVAAIEQQAQIQLSAGDESKTENNKENKSDAVTLDHNVGGVGDARQHQEEERYIRLPSPKILIREYNLASQYCTLFTNMTRLDFVELAIIEKLHRVGQMTDEEFAAREQEIKSRPTRGQRKTANKHINK